MSFTALEMVFGSMYSGNVILTSENVISILAIASLFLMQGLIDKCARTMIATIGKNNVISYYNASTAYGLPEVKRNTMQWLELNLVIKSEDSLLRNISPELMKDVVSSQNLLVYNYEYSVYSMLRKW